MGTHRYSSSRARAALQERRWLPLLGVAAGTLWGSGVGCSLLPQGLDGADDDDSTATDDDSAITDDDSAAADDDTFLEGGAPVVFEVLASGNGHAPPPWDEMDQEVGCAELNVRLAGSDLEYDEAITEALPPTYNGDPPDPPIDFSTTAVLVSFLSTCLNSGRSLSVIGLADDGTSLRIVEDRLDPCLDMFDVAVRPYNVIAIPAPDGERALSTRLDIVTPDCGE